MPSSVTLEDELEQVIQDLVRSGRYRSEGEVIRDGLRLIEERDRKLAALDAALTRGRADVEAGRVHPAGEVFAELKARYKGMATNRDLGE